MSIAVTCGSCGNRFRVPDSSVGRVVGCPKCNADVRVPDPSESLAPPSPGMGFQADYDRNPPSRNTEQPPPRQSDSNQNFSNNNRRKSPWGKVILLLSFVFGGCCLSCGGCGIWFVQDSKTWREFEAPGGRLRAQMPGRPQTKKENHKGDDGITREVTTHQSVDLSEQTIYVIAHVDFEELKPDFGKKRILLDDLSPFLEQGLDQFQKDLPKGAKERHRQKITFGPYEGREVVYDLPNNKGVAVARLFIVKKRVYFIAVGGPKFSLEHPHLPKFFDSVQPTDTPEFKLPAEKVGEPYQRKS